MSPGTGGGRRFAQPLLRWFDREARDLPWRRRRDPYRTWVSEVMLQQTTVDVVAPRFEAFVARFPDLRSLASADEEDVLAAWSGLGYYRRARALHRGARAVAGEHGGRIPSDPSLLRALPGVGAYTAGAIAALGHGVKAAAVDGNVARVMARVLAETGVIDAAATRARLEAAVLAAMPPSRPGAFTEALIELGALVCRPTAPDCGRCPIAGSCRAREEGRVAELPVRRARVRAVPLESIRAIVESGGRLLLVRRPSDASLLPGFWELPGRWAPPGEDPRSVLAAELARLGLTIARLLGEAGRARHAITHHRIVAIAFAVRVEGTLVEDGEARFIERDALPAALVTTETRKLLGIPQEAA